MKQAGHLLALALPLLAAMALKGALLDPPLAARAAERRRLRRQPRGRRGWRASSATSGRIRSTATPATRCASG